MKRFFAIGLLLICAALVYAGFAYKFGHNRDTTLGRDAPDSGSEFISKTVSAQTASPAAQEEREICTLSVAQAPEIGGLKLGMTPEQVLALFPGSKEDAEVRAQLAKPASPLGVSSFMLSPDKYASKAKFAGIRQITLTLLDGRVTTLSAAYNGPEWKHVDEFIAKFSEGRNLPAAPAWEAVAALETQSKILKCHDLEVGVYAGGAGGNLNHVRVQDMAAQKTVKERRAKAREQEAKQSKP